MRFLFEWQHVAPSSRLEGPEALAAVLSQLEAFEAPAAAWESEILPARIKDYAGTWLDELCTAGRTLWTRLRPHVAAGTGGVSGSLRATPVVLLPRRHAALWSGLAPAAPDEQPLGHRAQRVAEHLGFTTMALYRYVSSKDDLLLTAFRDKGRMSELLSRIPVHVIMNPKVGLLGAAAVAGRMLNPPATSSPPADTNPA